MQNSLHVFSVHFILGSLNVFEGDVAHVFPAFRRRTQHQESVDFFKPRRLWLAALDDLIDGGAGGSSVCTSESLDDFLRFRRESYCSSAGGRRVADAFLRIAPR